jgi:hypothetical protein
VPGAAMIVICARDRLVPTAATVRGAPVGIHCPGPAHSPAIGPRPTDERRNAGALPSPNSLSTAFPVCYVMRQQEKAGTVPNSATTKRW